MTPLLRVFDMLASLKFYCDVLGFGIVNTVGKPAPNCDWVLLKWGAVTLMLNTAYEAPHRPPRPVPNRVVAHRDLCLYFGCPNVDDAYRNLHAVGVEAEVPKVAPYGMKQLYLADPGGYSLCFQWPEIKGRVLLPGSYGCPVLA